MLGPLSVFVYLYQFVFLFSEAGNKFEVISCTFDFDDAHTVCSTVLAFNCFIPLVLKCYQGILSTHNS